MCMCRMQKYQTYFPFATVQWFCSHFSDITMAVHILYHVPKSFNWNKTIQTLTVIPNLGTSSYYRIYQIICGGAYFKKQAKWEETSTKNDRFRKSLSSFECSTLICLLFWLEWIYIPQTTLAIRNSSFFASLIQFNQIRWKMKKNSWLLSFVLG